MEKELVSEGPKKRKLEMGESSKLKNEQKGKEPLDLSFRPWSDLPTEILEPISSLLFLSDRIRFHAVCKDWQSIKIPRTCAPEPPWFASLSKEEGICTLFDTSCALTYQVNSPELIGASIHSSKFGWFMLSKAKHNYTSLFIYNPLRGDIIRLPALRLAKVDTAAFSVPPPSPDFMVCVINFVSLSSAGLVEIYTHQEDRCKDWMRCEVTVYNFIVQPHSPVILGGCVYFAANNGKIGIYNPIRRSFGMHEDMMLSTFGDMASFVAECEGQVLTVSVPTNNMPITVLKFGDNMRKRVGVEFIKGKALFVSPKGAILTRVGFERMTNKIYYPVFGPPCRCDRIESCSLDAQSSNPDLEFSLPRQISKFIEGGSNYSWAWFEPMPRER